jgi:hypothetical protein
MFNIYQFTHDLIIVTTYISLIIFILTIINKLRKNRREKIIYESYFKK